jgi:hypothetical protein
VEKKKKEGAIVGPAQAGPQRKEKKLAKLEEVSTVAQLIEPLQYLDQSRHGEAGAWRH